MWIPASVGWGSGLHMRAAWLSRGIHWLLTGHAVCPAPRVPSSLPSLLQQTVKLAPNKPFSPKVAFQVFCHCKKRRNHHQQRPSLHCPTIGYGEYCEEKNLTRNFREWLQSTPNLVIKTPMITAYVGQWWLCSISPQDLS